MAHKFGERLRELRKERNQHQRDLERALSLRPGTQSQYERGLREPGFDMLLTMADFFGVSVDYLLGRPGAVKAATSGSGGPAVWDRAAAGRFEAVAPATRLPRTRLQV